jgi:nucleotide-binding universal stress UspA family protein
VILIGYDGSADARRAIHCAGQLMKAEPATVLTVWEPVINAIPLGGPGTVYGWSDQVPTAQVNAVAQRSAEDQAEEGVELARQAGLNPQPRVHARVTTIADAILAVAEEVDARAIVLGTRGLTGLKSLMLGSVSHAVARHAKVPVMVVPSARRTEDASEAIPAPGAGRSSARGARA